MRRLGRTGHKDANQDEIVRALREIGASVAITSGAGYGLPDLIVGFRGETFLLEVKDGTKPMSKKKLSANEAYFVEHWKGRPVAIVESVADALRAIGIDQRWRAS